MIHWCVCVCVKSCKGSRFSESQNLQMFNVCLRYIKLSLFAPQKQDCDCDLRGMQPFLMLFITWLLDIAAVTSVACSFWSRLQSFNLDVFR